MSTEKSLELGSKDWLIYSLSEANKGVDSADLAVKYKKMAENPLSYQRGTNLQYWQYSRLPQSPTVTINAPKTVIQGDAHAANYSVYENSHGQPDYNLYDFDASLYANFLNDVCHMATSVVVTASIINSIPENMNGYLVDTFTGSYFATVLSLAVGRADTKIRIPQFKAEKSELDRWTHKDNGKRSFDIEGSNGNLVRVTASKREEIEAAMPAYINALYKSPKNASEKYFRVNDVAERKFQGVGSIGLPRYYVLIEGDEQHIILDIKKQPGPAGYRILPASESAEYTAFIGRYTGGAAKWHEAMFRSLTEHTDHHLGVMKLSEGDFSVRHRPDLNKNFQFDLIKSFRDMEEYCRTWGKVMALDHNRARTSFFNDYTIPGITVPVKSFAEELADFVNGSPAELRGAIKDWAMAAGAQNNKDYQIFLDWQKNK